MKKSITSIFSVGLIVLFSGCQQSANTPLKPRVDKGLPIVSKTSMKYIPDMTAIALEWKKIDVAAAAGYYIIRADMKENGKFRRIKTIHNKYVTHYLDTGLEPNSKYGYKISIMTKKGYESSASQTLFASTLPRYNSVSLIESISGLPRQIKVLWRPHPSERVAEYIIERRSPTQSKWKEIARVENRLNVEYIDENLGDNEIFMYRIKTRTFDGIYSKYSQTTQATTKGLPSHITQLEATRNLPQIIRLSWGKSRTKDIVAYNIYRSSSATGSFSKIATAPVVHNRFDDAINKDSVIYFYKITTIDKDGLESRKNDIAPTMGATLSKPRMPQITLAMIEGNKMVLNWIAGDNRAASYNIYKTSKGGWSDSRNITIPNVQGLRFEDPDVVRGVVYGYRLQAVDKNGLASDITNESTIKLPKIVIGGQQK